MGKYFGLVLLFITHISVAEQLKTVENSFIQPQQSEQRQKNSVAFEQLKQQAEQGDGLAQLNLAKLYQQDINATDNEVQAFYWYMSAAQQYYDEAELAVAQRFETGKGVNKSIVQAIYWYQRLAAKNNQYALYRLAYIYTNLYQDDEIKAIEGLEYAIQSAQLGYMPAQYLLGQIYQVGYQKLRDDEQAFRWYLKAAENNHNKAQYNVALAYYYGKGIHQDLANAAKWLERSATEGNVVAQYSLGLRYLSGQGVEKNAVKATEWFLAAAKAGNVFAQYSLAMRYALGEGVTKDNAQARHWFEKAALQNHQQAQYELGLNYLQSGNDGAAFKWLESAANSGYEIAQRKLQALKQPQPSPQQATKSLVEHTTIEKPVLTVQDIRVQADDIVKKLMQLAASGDAKAQNNLGVLYGKGELVNKDAQRSIFWLEQSATQGFVDALNNLAVIYVVGEMVNTDYQKAYELAKQSAAQNNQKGKLLLEFLSHKLKQ